MDQIKTKIEVGGYTISDAPQSELYEVSVALDPPFVLKKKVYDDEFEVIKKTTIYLTKKCVFYIDSDDPGKLHKFTGMKYEGLVDRPQDVFKVIDEFVKKFDGCTIIYSAHQVAIHGKRLHSIRGKSILFRSLATTTGEEFVGGVRVCRISHPHLEDVNLSHVKKNASEIISEFTRIMKEEDRA